MIETQEELRRVLDPTPLSGRPIEELRVPGHDQTAFAIDPGKVDVRDAGRLLYQKTAETGRWPVAALCYAGTGEDFREDVLAEDFFSRRPFRQEGGRSWPLRSVQELIDAAADLDLDEALAQQAGRLDDRSLEEAAEQELELLLQEHGQAPESDELRELVASGEIASLAQLQRWLLAWQAARLRPSWWRRLLGRGRYLNQWKMVDYVRPAMLLLPTLDSWTVPAFQSFWGAGRFTTPATVALLRRWNERWGAEVVAHFGTVLIFRVDRPPRTLEEALPLAWEQVTLAECTTILSGVPTIEHARVLVGRQEWSVHERP